MRQKPQSSVPQEFELCVTLKARDSEHNQWLTLPREARGMELSRREPRYRPPTTDRLMDYRGGADTRVHSEAPLRGQGQTDTGCPVTDSGHELRVGRSRKSAQLLTLSL